MSDFYSNAKRTQNSSPAPSSQQHNTNKEPAPNSNNAQDWSRVFKPPSLRADESTDHSKHFGASNNMDSSRSPWTDLLPEVDKIPEELIINAAIQQSQVVADYIYDLENNNRLLAQGLINLAKDNFHLAQTSMTLLTGHTEQIGELYFQPFQKYFQDLSSARHIGRRSRPAILTRAFPAKKMVQQDITFTTTVATSKTNTDRKGVPLGSIESPNTLLLNPESPASASLVIDPSCTISQLPPYDQLHASQIEATVSKAPRVPAQSSTSSIVGYSESKISMSPLALQLTAEVPPSRNDISLSTHHTVEKSAITVLKAAETIESFSASFALGPEVSFLPSLEAVSHNGQTGCSNQDIKVGRAKVSKDVLAKADEGQDNVASTYTISDSALETPDSATAPEDDLRILQNISESGDVVLSSSDRVEECAAHVTSPRHMLAGNTLPSDIAKFVLESCVPLKAPLSPFCVQAIFLAPDVSNIMQLDTRTFLAPPLEHISEHPGSAVSDTIQPDTLISVSEPGLRTSSLQVVAFKPGTHVSCVELSAEKKKNALIETMVSTSISPSNAPTKTKSDRSAASCPENALQTSQISSLDLSTSACTSTSKSPPNKGPNSDKPCKYYINGERCRNENHNNGCWFVHDLAARRANLAKRDFEASGSNNLPSEPGAPIPTFSVEAAPEAPQSLAPKMPREPKERQKCRTYLKGRTCPYELQKGGCRYIHDPVARQANLAKENPPSSGDTNSLDSKPAASIPSVMVVSGKLQNSSLDYSWWEKADQVLVPPVAVPAQIPETPSIKVTQMRIPRVASSAMQTTTTCHPRTLKQDIASCTENKILNIRTLEQEKFSSIQASKTPSSRTISQGTSTLSSSQRGLHHYQGFTANVAHSEPKISTLPLCGRTSSQKPQAIVADVPNRQTSSVTGHIASDITQVKSESSVSIRALQVPSPHALSGNVSEEKSLASDSSNIGIHQGGQTFTSNSPEERFLAFFNKKVEVW